MNWCVESKVERVYAESVSRALRDKEIADSYLALMKFQDGTIASLEVSWILPRSFSGRLDAKFEAVGTGGTIFVDGSGQVVEIYRADESTCPDVMYAPEIYGRYTGILRDEIVHFVECVQQDKVPAVTGQDGKAAVEVVCAIAESVEKQQPVYL
jgi:predicted dehydrogenase